MVTWRYGHTPVVSCKTVAESAINPPRRAAGSPLEPYTRGGLLARASALAGILGESAVLLTVNVQSGLGIAKRTARFLVGRRLRVFPVNVCATLCHKSSNSSGEFVAGRPSRSEEHTSELQSRPHL